MLRFGRQPRNQLSRDGVRRPFQDIPSIPHLAGMGAASALLAPAGEAARCYAHPLPRSPASYSV